MKDSPASLSLLLIVNGLGSLYYSVNLLALGLGRGALMEGSAMLEMLALAGLGLSGSVSIGTGLMLNRLRARNSGLPLASAIASAFLSLLTMFFPGLALSCYLVYLFREPSGGAPAPPVDPV